MTEVRSSQAAHEAFEARDEVQAFIRSRARALTADPPQVIYTDAVDGIGLTMPALTD